MSDALDRYIQAGEGISVEFKRCGSQPGQDTFETICSFANRQGGSILLGVRDDGAVEGVSEASALNIERNISNVTSNPNLFNVSPLVEFERLHDTEGRLVIRVWVPMGSSLYAFKGAVFDRVADADVRVRSDVQITSMMARKQSCLLMLLYIVKGFGVLVWLVRGGDGLDPEGGATFEFGQVAGAAFDLADAAGVDAEGVADLLLGDAVRDA